jgi:hypothetical protein
MSVCPIGDSVYLVANRIITSADLCRSSGAPGEC